MRAIKTKIILKSMEDYTPISFMQERNKAAELLNEHKRKIKGRKTTLLRVTKTTWIEVPAECCDKEERVNKIKKFTIFIIEFQPTHFQYVCLYKYPSFTIWQPPKICWYFFWICLKYWYITDYLSDRLFVRHLWKYNLQPLFK